MQLQLEPDQEIASGILVLALNDYDWVLTISSQLLQRETPRAGHLLRVQLSRLY